MSSVISMSSVCSCWQWLYLIERGHTSCEVRQFDKVCVCPRACTQCVQRNNVNAVVLIVGCDGCLSGQNTEANALSTVNVISRV